MAIGTWTVTVVHGDLEDEAESTAMRALAVRAWDLGCVRVDGTNDTTRFRMTDQIHALALLAECDRSALSFWKVTVR